MQQNFDEKIAKIPMNYEKRYWLLKFLIYENKYRPLGLLITLFALLIRLFNLGDRVFHYDEAMHSVFTLKILNYGHYARDPIYHGSFLE